MAGKEKGVTPLQGKDEDKRRTGVGEQALGETGRGGAGMPSRKDSDFVAGRERDNQSRLGLASPETRALGLYSLGVQLLCIF